jgi:hypothetical protein
VILCDWVYVTDFSVVNVHVDELFLNCMAIIGIEILSLVIRFEHFNKKMKLEAYSLIKVI